MKAWTIRDAAELYGIEGWGSGHFGINEAGHVEVQTEGGGIDLQHVVQDLVRRGLSMPLLLRFSDVLRDSIADLNGAFADKIAEYEYKGRYRTAMPVKVNQQRHVVEEIVEFGRPFGLGLEAGSKPELLVAIALMHDDDGLIVCNGYKDRAYIETAMLAQKLGRRVLIIVDRFDELALIIEASKRLQLKPTIGVRVKLSSRGIGRWAESTGARSKFGLTASELVHAVDALREADLLSQLQCIHFHVGSQISAIRTFKDALAEGARIFIDLYQMGAPLAYFDVGGGLAIDYDGSRTKFHASRNYSLHEYAGDVVYSIQSALDAHDIPHPTIISESGRALVAHHAVLVVNVLGRTGRTRPRLVAPDDGTPVHAVVEELRELVDSVSQKNFQECYHDAVQLKEEAESLYRHGILDLRARAVAEDLFWKVTMRIWRLVKDLDAVPEDLEPLEKQLSETYYCNFSVFQSVPDAWAVKHLFPIMPIHRLRERPDMRAVLADLTCDSDGKIDRFIGLHDVKTAIELHDVEPGAPYFLGIFLVGAYQEVLGDLHNLFGDVHAVHIRKDPGGGYQVAHVEQGDKVQEVLEYVAYDQRSLMARLRRSIEDALGNGKMSFEESATLVRNFESGLAGYTYLEDPTLSRGLFSDLAKEHSDGKKTRTEGRSPSNGVTPKADRPGKRP